MKGKVTILTVLLLIFSNGIFAQISNYSGQIPLKDLSSPVYGTDVIMHNDPTQYQSHAALTVAMNGWLYSCFALETGGYYILRSTDDGRTWDVSSFYWTGYKFTNLDIVVTGNSPAEFNIFVAYTCYDMSNPTYWYANLNKFPNDLTSFALINLESITSNYGYGDIKIASDYRYPASGASPYGLGLILTRNENSASKAMYYYSLDGGYNFVPQEIFSTNNEFFTKASIAYGRGAFNNYGRYFMAFQRIVGFSSPTGWITLGYTPTTINSTVSLIGTWGVQDVRNPSVACQFNNTDNSSGEFTVALFYESDVSGTGSDYNLVGSFNKIPVTTPFAGFTSFTVASGSGNTIQPDANFDPGYNNFLLTYYDQPNQKLVYVVNGQEMTDPNNWWVISPGYNDQATLINPWPKVEINPVYLQVAHVWINNPVNNGVALFDAEYSTVGIGENSISTGVKVTVMPNPVYDQARISFTMPEPAQASIVLSDIYGRVLSVENNLNTVKGINSFALDLREYPAGTYYCTVRTSSKQSMCKIVKL